MTVDVDNPLGFDFNENGKAELAESDIAKLVALGMAIMSCQIGHEARNLALLLERPDVKPDITPRKTLEYFGDSVLHAAERTFGQATCAMAKKVWESQEHEDFFRDLASTSAKLN